MEGVTAEYPAMSSALGKGLAMQYQGSKLTIKDKMVAKCKNAVTRWYKNRNSN